jgi:hypothetical protein
MDANSFEYFFRRENLYIRKKGIYRTGDTVAYISDGFFKVGRIVEITNNMFVISGAIYGFMDDIVFRQNIDDILGVLETDHTPRKRNKIA